MRALIVLMLLALSLNSCQTYTTDLNGQWTSLGSGLLLEISDSTDYAFYDYTDFACVPARSGDLSEMLPHLSLEQDTLTLRTGVVNYQFVPTKRTPKVCRVEVATNRLLEPLYNFDVFAQTVEEHFAFFEQTGVDWPTLRAEQRQKIVQNPTDVNLYLTIEETLELLKDNHGFIEASEEVYEQLEFMEFEEQEEGDLPEYGDFQVAAMVADTFLSEDLTEDSPLISWGKVNDSLGFIQVKAMWLYADLDIPQELIDDLGYVDAYVTTFNQMYEGDYIQKEVQVVSKIMDRVIADLAATNALIIDVRFNGGGQDAVSFEILSRFTTEPLQVATQKLRMGDGYTPIQPLSIQPATVTYSKPVYVLTSPQTGSAAEAFSIATMAMNNVKRIGAPTSGAMSTALEKTLPNGWPFAISNEVYMDNAGNAYEYLGVPSDIQIDYPKDRQDFFRSVVSDLEGDKSQILEIISELEQ